MNNIQAYNTIAKSKKISELFLGTIDVNWDFAKIGYTAVCTEALPLTFMEKMVCGIANLDGKVNLGDLAHIMGLNIENDVQNLKFQDFAETEILMETLRTLKQYGVIATPDDSFSYVELTEIGKEYYAKGRKFKPGEIKGFTMYFDLTVGDHAQAKSLFSKLSVDGSKEQPECPEIPYAEESFVKLYAENQIPQFYSERTGNSFTEMSVKSREFLYKKIVLGVIYNSSTESYRFEVIDNGGIDTDYISGYVNSEKNLNRYLELFLSEQPKSSESKADSQIKFEENIAKIQGDAEYAIFNEKPEIALQLVTTYAKSPQYMEIQNIFNYIKSNLKTNSVNDIFICLPELTEEAESEICTLSEDANTRIMLSCPDVENFDSRFGDNVFVLNGDNDSSLLLIMDDVAYCCENLVFSVNETKFSVEFLHKNEGKSKVELEQIRDLYARKFIPNELDKYDELLQITDFEDIRNRILELKDADKLVMFAESCVASTGNDGRLASLRARRDKQIEELVQKYSIKMMEELDNLRAKTPLEDIRTLDVMEKVQTSFSNFKGKLISEQNRDNEKGWGRHGVVLALNDSISSFESLLNKRDTYLRQELLPKSYIVDTNVFVHFPEIMDYIGKKDRIILSLRVLEELDKLKVTLDGNDKRNVKKAIKEINYKIRMNSKSFRMESADTRLLPEEFDKSNPDNLILSVALKYSDRNPFLITNDINFQNRAASMGIPFMGLVDLLPEDVYKSIVFTKPEKKNETAMPKDLSEIMKKAYKACVENSDEVLVAKFVNEIKIIKPGFETITFGYSKFKDLCAAYPSEIELYENSNNALCIRLIDFNDKERGHSQSNNLKDLESLNEEQQNILRELLVKMINEENSISPVSDGEIRKAFIQLTGINIKLKPVKQLRESLDIPSEKQRKSNFAN